MGFTSKKNSKKLIEKIEKGQPGGNQYAAVDLPDGEWSVDEINARVEVQGNQFATQYAGAQTSDIKSDVTGDLGDLSKFGLGKN
jgi:hypothetical protein